MNQQLRIYHTNRLEAFFSRRVWKRFVFVLLAYVFGMILLHYPPSFRMFACALTCVQQQRRRSTSWDEDVEGSFLGIDELKVQCTDTAMSTKQMNSYHSAAVVFCLVVVLVVALRSLLFLFFFVAYVLRCVPGLALLFEG